MSSVKSGKETLRTSLGRSSFAGSRNKSTNRKSDDKMRKKKGERDDSRDRNVSLQRRKMQLADFSSNLVHQKMRLVEKLLDFHIHNVLSCTFTELRRKEREEGFGISFSVPSVLNKDDKSLQKYTVRLSTSVKTEGISANAYEFEQSVRKRLRDEYRLDAAYAVERWFTSPNDDGFVFVVLRRLASMTQEEARRDVRNVVAQFMDPHLKEFWRQKQIQREAAGYTREDDKLKSVQEAVQRAISEKKEELERHRATRAELQKAGRVHRVQTALAMLKKDLGDISYLRYVVPERYEGRLRTQSKGELKRVQVQQEEKKEKEEEETARVKMDIEFKIIRDEVEALRDAIHKVKGDISTKETELEELRTTIAKNTERNNNKRNMSLTEQTLQLEYKLTETVQEEEKLQTTCDELRRQLQSMTVEQNILSAEVASEEAELAATLMEKDELVEALRLGLDKARTTVLHLRRQQNNVIQELNTMRETMLLSRSRGLASRKKLKSRMLTIVAELAVEDLLQKRLAAQLQWQREQLKDLQKSTLPHVSNMPPKLNMEQNMESFDRVVTLMKEVARYTHIDSNTESLPSQKEESTVSVQDRVVQFYDASLRLRADIATVITNDKKALFAARQQYEQIECQRIEWKLREEALVTAGVRSFQEAVANISDLPVPLPPVTSLLQEGQHLYATISHMLHSENRSKAILCLLNDYGEQRALGDGAKRLPFLRDITTSIKKEESVTVSSFQLPTPSPSHSTDVSKHALVPISITPVSSSSSAAYRKMVLQFIKNEIQPLYDANQISRVRFIDVVERVSRWFLSTCPSPQPILAENERQAICQEIQATLTWQDEQRLMKRGV